MTAHMNPRGKAVPRLPADAALAQFLAHHIDRSGLTNRELSQLCGFGKPNIISMIKMGHTRLPLDRLFVMATALDLDPADLFLRWMREHYGATWRELEPLVVRKQPCKRK